MTLSLSSHLILFFNNPTTTEIYTLSLHDALPISRSARVSLPAPSHPPAPACGHRRSPRSRPARRASMPRRPQRRSCRGGGRRSEEHTSELQSQFHLVCRLLLEKKKRQNNNS